MTGRPAVARYLDVRRTTTALCDGLSADDHMLQSMPEASPAKWHLAHTTWFFETFLLLPHTPGYPAFDPRFTFVFNSYYKSLDGHPDRARRGLFSRPSLDEVREYRRHVDEHMARWLEAGVSAGHEALVELGLNHEQQHQELLVTDIKHAFWSQPLRPAYRPAADVEPSSDRPFPLAWIDFPGGVFSIGHRGDGFAFDNESPAHDVLLRPFQLASRLVTNAEFLAFLDDGGYRRPDLWLSDGWDTVLAQRWRSPLYWEERDGRWTEFRCDGTHELDPDAPVCHVSFYEADAYARWAGARLATEEEWEVAGALRNEGAPPKPGFGLGGSVNLQQMFGACWQWTASPYIAYPGYHPPAGALGEYNGKFMCNQMVLRGGSCATPSSHTRATYRNFFPPQTRWQFAGIRLAR